MSWEWLRTWTPPEILVSEAETRRFGLSCARLQIADDPRAAAALPTVLDVLGAADADLVVVRYPQRLVTWSAHLMGSGRDLVHADTLSYWRLAVGSGRGDTAAGLVSGVESAPDGTEVQHFVGRVFADYANHYAADPLLDADAALAGYQEWATRSASTAGAVTVRDQASGELVALATIRTGDDHVEIELAGVQPAHQGRGVYAVLLAACERLADSAGAPHVVISTQAHNVGVQRAWARYGFEPVAAFTTVHALRRGLLSARMSASEL